MSRISRVIFGALVISVACGVVQLAFGHDLIGTGQAAAPESGVNRAAKADRDAVKSAAGPMRTFVLRFNGMPDTSVLVRMPAAKDPVKEEARSRPTPSMLKSGDRKNAVACEPVVSVLTEVAKLLQPGRCVT
jgi:hypothetical protein